MDGWVGDGGSGKAGSAQQPLGSRAGDAERRRGAGRRGEGRGGREEEGVRGRNLPPAASLSAPRLRTKGGTRMNSLLPAARDARGIIFPREELFGGDFLPSCQGAPRKCPSASGPGRGGLKVRASGGEGEWGMLSCLPRLSSAHPVFPRPGEALGVPGEVGAGE